MTKVEQAVLYFNQGFSCSQTIVSTYGPEFGIDRETAIRLAGVFGAGIARMAETCGAVTGALMVIGLRHGNTKPADKESKEKAYSLANEFVQKFRSRNRTILCRELLGCDLSTPEGMKTAKEKDLIISICPKFVEDAAEIIEEIFQREPYHELP